MKRASQLRSVKLPTSLRNGLKHLTDVLQAGASVVERERVLANLRTVFIHAVQNGLITAAQERVFAVQLDEICATIGPASPTRTDELVLN